MSSLLLRTTSLASATAGASNASTSAGHTSPSVSSMEEDLNRSSGSEASFEQREAGRCNVELDAANMLSALKHQLPPMSRKGLFSIPMPAAPTTGASLSASTSTSSLVPPPLVPAPSSLSLALFSASSSSSSSSPAPVRAPPTPAKPSLPPRPPRPPASATATLLPPSLLHAGDSDVDDDDEEESLRIEGDEYDELMEERSHFSRGGGGKAKQRKAGCKWTAKEDARLRAGVAAVGECQWEAIAAQFLQGGRSAIQCSHRWTKVLRPGLVKGPWTAEEDRIILSCRETGVVEWRDIALRLPGRLGKQCRDRWLNHLDPSINKGEWTEEEDRALAQAREQHGNAWATIAKLLPGRSENAIKNRWYSAKRAQQRSVIAAPSGWDLRLEKQAIAAYAARFSEDHDALDQFVPRVTAALQHHAGFDGRAYDLGALPAVNRQKLQRRLWAALKREVERLPDGHPLRAAMRQKANGGKEPPQMPPQPAQPSVPPNPQTTITAAPTPTAAATIPTTAAVPVPFPSMAMPYSPSPHVAAVLGLLTAAIRVEPDEGKRAAYCHALEATSKESRPALCFIEGVMGGGYGGVDLTRPEDREYLLGALAAAVSRGLFAC